MRLAGWRRSRDTAIFGWSRIVMRVFCPIHETVSLHDFLNGTQVSAVEFVALPAIFHMLMHPLPYCTPWLPHSTCVHGNEIPVFRNASVLFFSLSVSDI